MIFFLKKMFIDLGMMSLFVAWKVYGLDGAGNVFLFFSWMFTVASILVLFLVKGGQSTTKAKRIYHVVTDVFFACLLAYFGYFLLPAIRMIVLFFWCGKIRWD